MELKGKQKEWLDNNVGKKLTPDTRFQFDITMQMEEGAIVKKINFDVVWYILIQFEGDESLRLDIVKEILKDKQYLDAFQSCCGKPEAKRAIEEFLIFNPNILDGLKGYINFAELDDPVDFVTHALFIKYGDPGDSPEIDKMRVANVRTILSTGFKLPADSPVKRENGEFRKILYMDPFPTKFSVLQELLTADFSIFGSDEAMNKDVAIELIKLRKDAACQVIIKEYSEAFRKISLSIPGEEGPGNLADYFYWVVEDMEAVSFIKSILGIELTHKI